MKKKRTHIFTTGDRISARELQKLLSKPQKTHPGPRKSRDRHSGSVPPTEMLRALLSLEHIPFVPEYRFHPKRKWRFDFALPEHAIAIEVEGGHMGNPVRCNHCGRNVTRTLKNGPHKGCEILVREGGRHTSVKGYRADCEKYNQAAVLGWHLLRYTTDMLLEDPDQVVRDIKTLIQNKQEKRS